MNMAVHGGTLCVLATLFSIYLSNKKSWTNHNLVHLWYLVNDVCSHCGQTEHEKMCAEENVHQPWFRQHPTMLFNL